MYKCKNCDFQCSSIKLLEQHVLRESLDITEKQQRMLIKKYNKEWASHINEIKKET